MRVFDEESIFISLEKCVQFFGEFFEEKFQESSLVCALCGVNVGL
jgi:hypothetical protein